MPLSLLLVEDDPEFLELLMRRFRRRGFEVETASTCESALAACRETVSAAIIDRHLGGQDGLSLIERIHAFCPRLPVIILSGHASHEDSLAALARGAFAYLIKPCSFADLEAVVHKACGGAS